MIFASVSWPRASETANPWGRYTPVGELAKVVLVDPSVPANKKSVEYAYDAAGSRVSRTVKDANGDVLSVQKYLWAGMTTLLAVYDGADNLVARFEYAGGRMPLKMVQGGNIIYYLAYDQVGSLRAVFDAAGNLVHEIQYDSFGNILAETAATGYEGLVIPFGFAGGLADPDTGLVHFGYREYDPEIGQWISKDPIGFAGGNIYLYGYCGHDPISLSDSLGLMAWYDELLQASANVAAGFGDTITGGLTSLVRDAMGTNDFVDRSSGAYKIGVASGIAWDVAFMAASLGSLGSANAVAKNGAGRTATALERGVCFVQGTPVATERGYVPIEQIKKGDRVWSYNVDTGQNDLNPVVQTFERTAPETVVVTVEKERPRSARESRNGTADGDSQTGGEDADEDPDQYGTIQATPEHPFWVVGKGWTGVVDLQPGDALQTLDGTTATVVSTLPLCLDQRVYNIEIADAHD